MAAKRKYTKSGKYTFKGRVPKKISYCLNCNKKLSIPSSKRCVPCNTTYMIEEGIHNFVGKNNHKYIDGRTNKLYLCPDCGVKVFSYQSKRCRSCANKGELNPNYTIGITNKIQRCVECGDRICFNNYLYGEKRCRSCASMGELNNLYKGGITPIALLIRGSKPYLTWRTFVFQRDNYTCQECGVKGGKLEAHHLKKFSKLLEEFIIKNFDENSIKDTRRVLRLSKKYTPFWDLNNGKTLCELCHKLTENYGNKGGVECLK